jgi:glutaredoxin
MVKVYGADWCAMTTRTREHLDALEIPYDYIDVEDDPAASDWVKEQNGGKEKKPTVDLDGEILSEPTNAQLDKALEKAGLLTSRSR